MTSFAYNLNYSAPGGCPSPFLYVMPSPSQPPKSLEPIGKVAKAVWEAKERSGCRPCYVTGLRQYLNQFVRGRESRIISDFAVEDIEKWFSDRKENAGSQLSNRGRLAALFSYAKRRGYITDNPMERLEPLRHLRGPIKIMTMDQVKSCLRFAKANPRYKATLVLNLLVPLRPSETEKIGWGDIEVNQGCITVGAAASKIRKRRIVELHPTAIAWLRTCPGWQARVTIDSTEDVDDLPLPKATQRRFLRRMRDAAGMANWTQDLMRHTVISMLLPIWKDLGRLSLSAGNSPGIILNHYRALVSTETANEFWNLTPDKV